MTVPITRLRHWCH